MYFAYIFGFLIVSIWTPQAKILCVKVIVNLPPINYYLPKWPLEVRSSMEWGEGGGYGPDGGGGGCD